MKLDLGGIVKGYAADKARSILQEQGIEDAQINFGGTVIAMGKMQKIGIQNPFQKTGTTMASIALKDKAIVTSGSYEQFFFIRESDSITLLTHRQENHLALVYFPYHSLVIKQ